MTAKPAKGAPLEPAAWDHLKAQYIARCEREAAQARRSVLHLPKKAPPSPGTPAQKAPKPDPKGSGAGKPEKRS